MFNGSGTSGKEDAENIFKLYIMSLRFISFSGGVESTTMCILYGKGATAIWCDTGDEEVEMYERIDFCEKRLLEIHGGDFELKRIKPNVKVKGEYMASISEASMYKGFPSANRRWCTERFKIQPIDNFLKQQGDCELMIGFNADEEVGKDRTGNFMTCKNVKYSYPLYDDGYTRDDCESILVDHGLHPFFPVYMSRGGCKHCFFKSKAELKAKYIFNKDGFMENESFENRLNDSYSRKKFYAINMNAGTYKSIREEVEREIAMWGLDEVKAMYLKVRPHKVCGAFCHR